MFTPRSIGAFGNRAGAQDGAGGVLSDLPGKPDGLMPKLEDRKFVENERDDLNEVFAGMRLRERLDAGAGGRAGLTASATPRMMLRERESTMAYMSFHVTGAGISNISAGHVVLAFDNNGVKTLYDAFCTGTSWAECCSWGTFWVTNDLPDTAVSRADESLLNDFRGRVVTLKLEGCLPGSGPMPMTFAIYDSNLPDPVYKVSRRPKAKGVTLSTLDICTTFVRLDLDQGANDTIYEMLKAGELDIPE